MDNAAFCVVHIPTTIPIRAEHPVGTYTEAMDYSGRERLRLGPFSSIL